jgi:steroid 5-alpha reductase family enzyme
MTTASYDILLYAAAGASLLMALLWLRQYRTRDASSVDVAWATGVGALAIVYAVYAQGYLPRRLLVGVLGAVWSFRLVFYLLTDRVLKANAEDGRYQMLRQKWGPRAQRNFFLFFQAQALFVFAFGLPFFAAATAPHPALTVWDFLGTTVWLVSVIGETAADRQLARFRRDPASRGRICRSGLWRYSRHPNYFFEWLHWWSYVLLAAHSPWWWASLLGPAFMLYLLFYVTGIPYTEKRALASRGDAYRAYQRSTSVFIPWFPRDPDRNEAKTEESVP